MNLHNVLVSLKAERAKLDAAIKAIEELAVASGNASSTVVKPTPAKNSQTRSGRLSPAARARISKAQKARWAKIKNQRAATAKK